MIALLSKFLLSLSRRRRISEQGTISPRSTGYPEAIPLCLLLMERHNLNSPLSWDVSILPKGEGNERNISVLRRMRKIDIGGRKRYQQSSSITNTTNLKSS
jgi:hypothetical protein